MNKGFDSSIQRSAAWIAFLLVGLFAYRTKRPAWVIIVASIVAYIVFFYGVIGIRILLVRYGLYLKEIPEYT